MLLGTVIGKVWSTRKEESLSGLRLLLIRPWLSDGRETAESIVAVDPIGADVGERVLVVFGRAARHAIGRGQDIGFQTAVVGVVDELDCPLAAAVTHERPAVTASTQEGSATEKQP